MGPETGLRNLNVFGDYSRELYGLLNAVLSNLHKD
jgi:hypothetical protein